MIRPLLAAACLIAIPGLASAQAAPAAPAAPAQAATPSPQALAMAQLFMPEELMEKVALRGAVRGMAAAARNDPAAREMEEKYPGISAAIWSAVEPEFRRFAREEHPNYLIVIASIYSSNLTPRELDALLALYSTPTGQKIIDQLHRAMLPDEVVAETVRTGEMPETAMRSAMAAQARKVYDSLTAEDRAVIVAAMRSIPMEKVQRVNSELTQAVMQWASKPRPELDERIRQLVEPVVQRFVKEHPARS